MKIKSISLFLIATFSIFTACNNKQKSQTVRKKQKPNIVIIYTDDLGYGDVSAYGATEIKTPNIDNLARNGVRFTDGHATSATCTPSRYGILTGTYPWRNKRAKILPGTAQLIIDTMQQTIPKMLRENGYHTGIVGKWHLGLGNGIVDWNKTISPGPNEVGFNYSFIMAATQDRVPTVFIENGNVVGRDPNDPIQISYKKNFEGEPTGKDNPELTRMKWHHGHNNSIVNGIPRIGFMKGGKKAKWIDEEIADTFLSKAKQFVSNHKNEPFFLYYAMNEPHVPRTPNKRFVGKSGMGPRGDVIIEADWCIGNFVSFLNKEGLLENTLIIFSSDNGPVINDGYFDDSVEKLGKHTPSGILRGGKYSLFEAGTRVPFITYWKGKIEPKVSDALVCQIDIYASLAELVGSKNQTTDSHPMLDVFLGKSTNGRKELVLEATSRTALRQGDWIMIPPYKGPARIKSVNIETGNSKRYQLYNLSDDVVQQKNQADTNKKKLNEMINEFRKVRGNNLNHTKKLELK